MVEEPGLLGSTEWAETHAADLQKHAVVYINSDGNGRGFFHADGSHTLRKLRHGVMKDIQDPERSSTVWKRAQLAGLARSTPERRKELRTRPDQRISALGSGSDYTVFIDHLGIASLNFGYGGEGGGGGVYHSIYDDFYWYTHFADTDFTYGRALAQTAGTAVIRLAGLWRPPVPVHRFLRHHPHLHRRDQTTGGQPHAPKSKNKTWS